MNHNQFWVGVTKREAKAWDALNTRWHAQVCRLTDHPEVIER